MNWTPQKKNKRPKAKEMTFERGRELLAQGKVIFIGNKPE